MHSKALQINENGILKKCLSSPQEDKKKENREVKNRDNTHRTKY